jgi:hypothetical protein
MTADITDVLDQWIATRELSDQEIALLESEHEETMQNLPLVVSMNIADSIYCSEAELPEGTFLPVVIASVLDFVDPANHSGSPQAAPERTIRLLDGMVANELIDDFEANEILNRMGHGN